jgi:hypothetical protein
VLRLFTRIFGGAQKPRLEVADVVTGGKGDVAWARFNWTLSGIERSRPGVATALFVREDGSWRVMSIQNTPRGHAMRSTGPSPAPTASPSPHRH